MAITARRIAASLVVSLAAYASLGVTNATQLADCERRIANVTHDDIHFNISISRDGKLFEIVVPEKDGAPQRAVSIRVRFRDESVAEGRLERQPSVGNGGYVDWRYQFDAKRALTFASIVSVKISIGDQAFEVFAW